MAGRYTGYQLWADRTFQEAGQSRTYPYTTPVYNCPHSQATYQFQHEFESQRLHYDSPQTACCGEPVANFYYQPQYKETENPHPVTNCAGRVGAIPCNAVDVSYQDCSGCTEATPLFKGIEVRCPGLCQDMLAVISGGEYAGQYGNFRYQGQHSQDDVYLDYEVLPSIYEEHYNTCAGTTTYTELFCGGLAQLQFTLMGGLDQPNDCYCDCCGDNGEFGAPSMAFNSSTPTATWYNNFTPSTITGSTACKDGSISGQWNPTVGSGHTITYSAPITYYSDGTSRYLQGTAAYAGTAAGSACCGGYIRWTGSDGCGNSPTPEDWTIAAKWTGTPAINITGTMRNGTTFVEGTQYTIKGEESCSYATLASLVTSNENCITGSTGTAYPGYLQIYRTFTLSVGGTCADCCGEGSFDLSFNNGCNQTDSGSYTVEHVWNAGNFGNCFRCYEDSPGSYIVQWTNWNCQNGCLSTWWNLGIGPYGSLATCLGYINSPSGTGVNMNAPYSCGNLDCCKYYDNGAGLSEDFRAITIKAEDQTCCDWPDDTWNNTAWINNYGDPCCPKD